MRPASTTGPELAAAASSPAMARLVLIVLGFAAGYFLSYLFRSVNAVVVLG